MRKKRKWLLITGGIIIIAAVIFIISDIAIFDTSQIPDEAYLKEEDSYARREKVERCC